MFRVTDYFAKSSRSLKVNDTLEYGVMSLYVFHCNSVSSIIFETFSVK